MTQPVGGAAFYRTRYGRTKTRLEEFVEELAKDDAERGIE